MIQINLTLLELQRLVQFARDKGEGEFKTVTISVDNLSGIGQEVEVTTSTSIKDVTDTNCW